VRSQRSSSAWARACCIEPTRAVRLTDAGASYLGHCKRILAEVEAAESLVASSHRALSGSLTITAPLLFGRLHVAPVLTEFLKRHRHVSMRVMFADHLLDFFEQNIDVAIRIAHLPDSSLRAIRVGTVRRVVCASPAYLRVNGAPRHPRELIEHETLGFSGMVEPHAWSFTVDGRHERFPVRPRLVVNNADLAIAAARSGQGLTKVLSYQVADEIEHKRLRIVLAEYELEPVPIHVVHVEGKNSSARVRAFVGLAVEKLRLALA